MGKELVQDVFLVAPMIVIFLTSLIPLFVKVAIGNREPNPASSLIYGLFGLMGAAGLTAAAAGISKTAFNNALIFDGLTSWTSYLIYFIAAVSLMLAYDHTHTRGKQFAEFVFLMMNSVVGMLILIASNDLIVTFIGIETMSLCLYILVAMSKEEILSKEASFKYFVLGSFASAIFLYGVALIFGTAGGTYLPQIAASVEKGLLGQDRLFLVGMSFVILGFAFKVSIFPFHAWTPDVYQGAPTPVTAFMSTAVKTAAFIAFIRIFDAPGFENADTLMNVMMWMAILTMTVGNVGALMQNNLKRVLAYSSVAHSGYVLVGVIAFAFSSTAPAAIAGVVFYLFTYAVMTLGAFAVVGMFEKHSGTVIDVDNLKGLASKYPRLALCFTILMLSMAGIPPTLGFFGKFYIFSAAIEQNFYWLALWGVLNSVVSVYYYLRPVVMMYMVEGDAPQISGYLLTKVAVVFATVVVIVLGLYSSPLLQAVLKSVSP